MAWYNKLGLYSQSQLDEQKKYFLNKGADANKIKEDEYGEGIEDINLLGYGSVGLQSFTKFYDKYLNRVFKNEAAKIIAYRKMADSPEIGDVIEDAVNESTQEDDDGNVITLNITADHLVKNKNITKNLHKAFEELFYDKIDIDDKIWDLFKSFLIDGRLYYERIAKDSQVKNGIINMKKLPAETMDMDYDPRTGKILRFYQYLGKNVKRPNSLQEAQQREDIVVFNPEQIGFINYGSYGLTKYEMFGFLEKSKVPYNQLKLIETAIIIYRIVRAPERLVFKIDTGAMPRDKAMKFVEKIKTRFIKKQTYDPATGRLSQDPEVLSILDNFFIPTSSDGRGSDITTVGGNAEGFKNLDDLFHFQKALYRSLKYPLSRIEKSSEGQSSDVLFGGGHAAEITRDEIKWAKFLERQQNILCKELKKLFLLHLEFTGMKKQYSLEDTDFHIKMTPPSHYKESMEQGYLAQNFDNYNSLSNNAEFSKYYLMKKYLHWGDDEIKDNVAGLEKDKELFGDVMAEMGGGMGGGFGGDEGGFGGQEGGLVGAEMTGEEQPEEGE